MNDPKRMPKRLIRKQPLSAKLKSYPFDLYLYLNELRLSIDWNVYAKNVALPLGATLSLLFLSLAKALSHYESVNAKLLNSLFQTNYHSYEELKWRLSDMSDQSKVNQNDKLRAKYKDTSRSTVWFINITAYSLLISAFLNAFLCANAYRNYYLLYCSEEPRSSSVMKVTLSNNGVLDKLLQFLGFQDQTTDDNESEMQDQSDLNLFEKEIYQLKMWVPSKFQLYLAISFNPLNLLFIKLTSKELSIIKSSILVTLISFTFHLLITKFLLLIEDKQILYQEMFSEFNNKFVKPKTNILKKDVLIDSTRGPLGSTVLTDVNPFLFNKLKVFITHDIDGKEVKNYNHEGDLTNHVEDRDQGNTFSRGQTYNQLQFNNSMNNDRHLSFDHDPSHTQRGNHERRLDFLKSLEENDEEIDDFDYLYSSSTPFKPASKLKISHSSRNNENLASTRAKSDLSFKSPLYNRTPSPIKLNKLANLRAADNRFASPDRISSTYRHLERSPESQRNLSFRSAGVRSPTRTPSPSKPRWR